MTKEKRPNKTSPKKRAMETVKTIERTPETK